MRALVWITLLFLYLCNSSCTLDKLPENEGDLIHIPFEQISYNLVIPESLQPVEIPASNPLTQDGVELGRHLFFDPILSVDSTLSCSSCHDPKLAFTDGEMTSEGVTGERGIRSSMSLINSVYFNTGMFWDGRSPSLEDQALLPIEDPKELNDDWENVEAKMRRSSFYPEMFRKAFGIDDRKEITRQLAAKALAQYQRTLLVGNSKFDRFSRNEIFLEEDERIGFQMFFDSSALFPDAECAHCHPPPLFTTNEYINNGIEPISDLSEFEDKGRGEVSGNSFDNGKFRVTSLRNIELSAPYMHDGRFETLEEVLDHYDLGGSGLINEDELITPLDLTEEQKQQIIAFLKTLTDTSYYENEHFFSPFE